jgi:hypothetical protein
MRYEMISCNGKAISKVMGWGIILKMIRDKYVTWETWVEMVTDRTDWEHQALQGFDVLEWRV